MKGNHHIIIETDRLKYEFTIRRNITLIQGDSATGKTTLINILQAYSRNGLKSGVRLESDVPCVVYNSGNANWNTTLESIQHSIVFFDEDCPFVKTKEFASFIQGTDNYYVFITRNSLRNLPYSIHEIYGIRTSGKFHFPEQVYHEFYPLFPLKEDAK